jgi:hypothetical protein
LIGKTDFHRWQKIDVRVGLERRQVFYAETLQSTEVGGTSLVYSMAALTHSPFSFAETSALSQTSGPLHSLFL